MSLKLRNVALLKLVAQVSNLHSNDKMKKTDVMVG